MMILNNRSVSGDDLGWRKAMARILSMLFLGLFLINQGSKTFAGDGFLCEVYVKGLDSRSRVEFYGLPKEEDISLGNDRKLNLKYIDETEAEFSPLRQGPGLYYRVYSIGRQSTPFQKFELQVDTGLPFFDHEDWTLTCF